ncbi:MAG: ABC transporter permease [Phycisphaerales bacterium]|nr:ABC transporter permease [Phycisphaerales bacterium]
MNTNVYKRPPMLALLIKDFRLCKPVIVAGLVALFIPTAAFLFGTAVDRAFPSSIHPEHVREFLQDLMTMMIFGLLLSAITLPAVAAVAAARERRDRSGEFLHTVPIRRSRIVVSRIAVVFAWAIILLFIGAGLTEILRPAGADGLFTPQDGGGFDASPAALLIATYLLLLGAGWVLGAILRSDTIAAAVALGACTLLGVVLALEQNHIQDHWTPSGQWPPLFYFRFLVWLLIAIGSTTLIAGTIISLRRTSP